MATPWVSAYYTTWTVGSPAPANIDMRAITHLLFFALAPNSDGTLTDTDGGITANASAVKSVAHNAGKKVLICIGGGGTAPAFRGAISSAHRAAFVTNIVNWVTANGYDGVDLDMEPMASTDATDYQAFVTALRTALGTGKLLTAAVEPYGFPSIFAPIQSQFDQINIMTYDMSGAWPGWCSWHNANLYQGGQYMPSTGNPMPSCEGALNGYISAGVPKTKLAIGAAFYGTQWTYVTGPMQATNASSTNTNYTYAQIMDSYYTAGSYHWDAAAHASYLGITSSSPVQFISYDDTRLVGEKMNYVINAGLGGLMCWSIGQQYRPSQTGTAQQALLDAIYTAYGTGTTITTTDPLSNFTLVSSKSANWAIDATNPTYYNGDTGRANRTVDDTEYLVYSYANISSFSAKVYTWNSSINNVTFWYSMDGGPTYTQAATTAGSKTITTSPWGYNTVVNTALLPVGVNRLKIQMTATGNNWDPQLSQISITHR